VAARRRRLRWYERPLERAASSKPGGWYFLHVAMPIDRVLLPLTRGRVSSAIGQQVGLLETVGARSGEPRRTPLVYLVDGERIVLIASKAGAARHPAWLHNLRADPRVSFLAPRGRSGSYVAREAGGEERERLWADAVDYYAGYADYQQRAGARRIPVVVLERAAPGP
jgi:deazaflavin-dependent oxidoreductase (nitroreductase family)